MRHKVGVLTVNRVRKGNLDREAEDEELGLDLERE